MAYLRRKLYLQTTIASYMGVPRAVVCQAQAMSLLTLRDVTTGGDVSESEREQWEDGNNLLRFAPGVVTHECNLYTNTLLRKAGFVVITLPSSGSARA